MINFWLDRYKVGRRVRYVGLDRDLCGKFGAIIRHLPNGYLEVDFDFLGIFTTKRTVIVKRQEIIVL